MWLTMFKGLMISILILLSLMVVSPQLLGGCATRPVNRPITRYDPSNEHQFEGLDRPENHLSPGE